MSILLWLLKKSLTSTLRSSKCTSNKYHMGITLKTVSIPSIQMLTAILRILKQLTNVNNTSALSTIKDSLTN